MPFINYKEEIMAKPNIAIVDADMYKYMCAFAGENRSVLVEHPNGFSEEFKNRTAFYGRRKDDGVGIKKLNAKRDSPLTYDEFTYTDIQRLKPFDQVYFSTKNTIESHLRAAGVTDPYRKAKFFMGEGESFRVERSTLLKYKGQRNNQIKPLLIDEITQFIEHEYNAEIVSSIEADDKVVMECYNNPNRFSVIADKDAWGTPANVFDINQQHRGIVNCNKFGHLFLDSKRRVRGEGRIFLYYQVLSQDAVDNYKANCFSDIRWGDMAAFNALVDCKNDKEALQSLVDSYKILYPEPKIVTGWRGDEIKIDWLYVATENFDLARMLRWEGDEVVFEDVLKRMEIDYE